MNLCVIGTGYAGIVNAVGFASIGNSVACVDIDEKKVALINSGKSPIFEPELEEKLAAAIKAGKIHATTDLKAAVSGAEIIFVSVGTPSKHDGGIDLKYIEIAAKSLGEVLKSKGYCVVIMKSTVVPGTTEGIFRKIVEEKSGKKAGIDFGLSMCPEFLREGHAVHDFSNPDRVVIGTFDKKSEELVVKLHDPLKSKTIVTDIKTAEMIKYASNAFLATKISFANEIGNICKKLGIDVYDVMKGVGADGRISPHFFNAGAGFGGSCFPKDVKALVAKSKEIGYEPKLLETALEVNEKQPLMLVEHLKKRAGELKKLKVTLLGLAFKPHTDDIREAPSLKIISALLDEGAQITAYDPQAKENVRAHFGDKIKYAATLKEALEFSKHILIVTEWDEFRDESLYKGKIVIDGRKTLDKKTSGDYEGVCW
ncbi:UDP-glucose 6-dehydrogenase AglM [uncultured archaeon]|nr:UDP-glucose 6-dehydrogenase AglM [uncultured archaeon]